MQNPDYCSYESTSGPVSLPSCTQISPDVIKVIYLDMRKTLGHVGKYVLFKEIFKLL